MRTQLTKVAAVALALWCLTAGANGTTDCKPIKGTIVTTQTTEGCQSPVGICFTGVLKTNSFLKGTTYFTVTSVSTDTATNTTTYQGTLVVTTSGGATYTFASMGTVNNTTNTFTETDVAFVGAGSITLTITGTTNATSTAFYGDVTGTACGVQPS